MVRSILFQLTYYAASAFFVLSAIPLSFLKSRAPMAAWIQRYTCTMVWLMRVVGGIQVKVRGLEHLPPGPVIIAAKHQSWGDGFVMFSQVADLAFVTGDHLLKFPFAGQILRKLGAIVVDNCGGAHARGRLVADEMAAVKEDGRSILIYPEGHLSAVGTQHRYRKGVFHLYEQYGVPVVPVATDLGLRWPEQSIWLRPGPAHVEFLPPIHPGREKEAFMADLEHAIESRSLALLAEQRKAGTLPADIAGQIAATKEI